MSFHENTFEKKDKNLFSSSDGSNCKTNLKMEEKNHLKKKSTS